MQVKPLFFLPKKGVEMIRLVTKHLDNVEVDTFTGLLVDFAASKNATVIVKGLRTVADFEYEFQMALLNKALNPEYETMFMMTNTKYSYTVRAWLRSLRDFMEI